MTNTSDSGKGKFYVINEDGTESKLYVNFSSKALNKTRAQRMAEQYGKKLEESTGIKLEPVQIKQDSIESSEKIAKRKLAIAKLVTFKDLLG